MATESRRLIILALVANAFIAVTKFVAAGVSGSSAMLAEGIHSVADTGNQIFLLRGESASRFEANVRHPFGRGKELYFWSFMVAVFLFVGGGALSIYEGFRKLREGGEHEPTGLIFSLIVLGVAAVFEVFIAFRPALAEFNRRRSGRSIVRSIREGKDPALMIVLFEDFAAVLGLVIAAAGLTLAYLTGNVVFDGAASIVIGVLLTAVAWVIAVEMKAMLVGEAATREDRAAIRAAAYGVEAVERVNKLLTMQLAAEQVLVNMEIVFDDGLTQDGLEQAIVAVESAVRAAVPSAGRVFIEPSI
jgi:cation diffusion facilitator family transporter